MVNNDQVVEQGRVIAIGEGSVWVETLRRSTCYSCEIKSGCGQSLLSRWLDGRINHLQVNTELSLAVGDDVELGLPAGAVVVGALWQYGLPLLLLILGSSVGQFFVDYSQLAPDWVPLFGFAGLLLGFVLLRYRSSRESQNRYYQPVILRRIIKESEQPVTLR